MSLEPSKMKSARPLSKAEILRTFAASSRSRKTNEEFAKRMMLKQTGEVRVALEIDKPAAPLGPFARRAV